MKISWRVGALIVVLWTAMVLAPSCGLAAEAAGALVEGGLGSSLLEPVGGGRQAAEERDARLSSPEALAEDTRSRMAFAGYKQAGAVALARRVFGIGRPDWTPPQQQGSGRITGYSGEHLAQELLPDGRHVLVVSSLPLRSAVGDGEERPVSLTLGADGSGYAPANPLVPVVLGKNPAEGASFEFGMRMSPVEHSAPEAAEVVGGSVFYPGTGKDTDFMLEPRPLGVEASWQLLSAESSEENALSFTLPAGGQLVMSKSIEGAVEVLVEGQRQLLIMPASATQADGAALPVSYTINGNSLVTHVDLSGSVDFPVEVDPVVIQTYTNGFWDNWLRSESIPNVAEFLQGTGIYAELLPEAPGGEWADWGLYAPGYAAKEGSLMRMDVTEMEHKFSGQSNIEAGIVGEHGSPMPNPIYTYDGENPADTKAGMLLTSEEFTKRPVAFCAEGGGGYDGGSKPLCNESVGGEYFRLTVDNWQRQTYRQFEFIEAATARFIDSSNIKASVSSATEINGTDNVLSGTGHWLGPNSGALEAIGSDPAFGVKRMTVDVAGKSVSREYSAEGDCAGILCGAEEHQALRYGNFPGGLPDGHDEIKVEAEDSSSLTAIWGSTVNVDNEKPYNLKVGGADVKGETINITEGPAGDQLTLEASDGANGVVSSGINRMGVWIDGVQHGSWEGSCSPGPCTAKATWALNGRELGAGVHSLVVKAIDGAENEETKSYTLAVHAAAPVAMGPGSVNPASGDFALESTDVDLKDGAGALAVTQHYDSRNVKEGAGGPLGPEWTIGLGQLSVLEAIESGGSLEGIVVVGAEGVWFFKPKGSGAFESPPEDVSLTLTQTGGEWKKATFTLEDKKTGANTTFTKPSEEASQWLPTVSTSAAASKTLTDSYITVEIEGKKVVEPSEELAPHGAEKCPTAVKEMQSGCRALLFHYGNEHTEQPEASGEARSQWGWYAGRLTQVVAVAWNTSANEMQEVPVAEFSYDKQGRLRAEWDPRIKPALKTIYGYDSENHVTAVSPPGQQPWLMTYGTTEGDASTGRLIKTTRPKASTTLWEGQDPENKEAPAITGTPTVGTRLAVSEGKWANSPLAYGYQWVRCNVHRQECHPIPGATNANYTVSTADVGATLEVEVSATNSGGTTSLSTAATAEVTAKTQFVDHQESVDAPNALDSVSCLPETTDCVLGDSKGNEIYTTDVSAKASASWLTWSGPGVGASRGLSCPGSGLCLVTSGSGAEWGLYYATSLGGSWTKAAKAGSALTVSCVSTSLCVDGLLTENVGYSTKPASESWSQTASGKAIMSSSACLPAGFCVIGDTGGSLHVAPSTSKIETGSWTETTVQSAKVLVSVACSSTTSCLAIDNTADVLALTINSSGTVTAIQPKEIDTGGALSAVSCSKQTCVAVDGRGNLFVSTNSGSTWSAADDLGGVLTDISCASPSLCLVTNNENEVTAVNPSEEVRNEGAVKAPQPGTTIEYNVPVSGAGAPYEMGAKEVEAWSQKDDPAEATAIFSEEHPQGWPASGHIGATVDYMDDEANVVNVVAPNGAVATNEYENGEVVRALSPGNRVRALKEASPHEAAEKLSTISKYNENTELAEVKGPEHKIKLSSGEEVEARNHVQYSYDEGAPYNKSDESEGYGLVTKTTDGALLANGEEKDRRTTLTEYSGQEDLGWKLREPTSVTTEPTGADLVSSTKYNKETGAVEETRTPGGNAETVSPPEPTSTFGSLGSGNGQFDDPEGVAFGPEGDVWVADEENNRIDRFTSTGTFVAKYGSIGGGQGAYREPNGIAINQKTGAVYIADTGNNKIQELNNEGKFVKEWGKAGSGTGEFEDPDAVAIDGAGNVWVSDWEDDRVQEFSETGTFIRQFGAKGVGDGQFEHITGLAFSQDMLYVVDTGNKRVQEFSTAGSEVRYTGQFGTPGGGDGQFEKPWGIATSPTTGDLYVSDEHDDAVLQFSPAGKFLEEFGGYGTGKGEVVDPKGLAVSATGGVYITDRGNDRISVWAPPEAGGAHMVFSTQLVSEGTGPGQFEYAAFMAIDGQGNVWVTDEDNHNVQVLSPQEKFIASYGSYGSGNGQFEKPTGVAINQAAKDVYVADCTANRIQELTTAGAFVRTFGSEGSGAGQLKCPQGLAIDGNGDVWVADRGNNRVEEFSASGSYIAAYGSAGTGNLQFKEPDDLAVSGGDIYVADTQNNRIQEVSPEGHYVAQFGEEGGNGSQLEDPEGITANQAGDLFVLDSGNNRIEEFTPAGHYLQTIASHGKEEDQLNGPKGITATAAGAIYVTEPNESRIQKWIPANQAVHDTKSIYYSSKEEAGVKACENRPQWAGLLCRTEPVAQPTDSAAEPKGEQLADLPVVTIEYNMWLQPVKTIETIGNKERIKTTVYEGERPTEESIQAAAGGQMAPVRLKYSASQGALVEQSSGSGSEAKTITRVLNTLGQLESYTDAAGNATTYSYDQYGRPVEINDDGSQLDGIEAKQRLKYEEATGQLVEIEDLGGKGTYGERGVGAFKATYGLEGELVSESYPNDMTATYAYNSIGEGTSLAYTKNNHCTGSECEWFHDTLTPSIHGEAISQSSSLASVKYAYEVPGRLSEVQETPAGEDCTARIYTTSEEGDRTSLTTRKSSGSECTASEGGTTERHTYDEANRLTDEEVEYEPLGNIKKLPAADAGGHTLETSYYADGQAQSQSQNGITNEYQLDPENRTTLTTTHTGEAITAEVISHYPGPGSIAPSWTYNQTSKTWTRSIAAFGGLIAVEESGKQAVLQLRDLQGNIIGTASLSETAGKPLSTERSTEYGVPTSEKPQDKYNWLGTTGITTNLTSGSIVQDGATYVPQIGAPLQAEGIPLPPEALTAVPYVLTVSPIYVAKNETWEEAYGRETPAGNIPEPGGEGTASGSIGDPVHCRITAYEPVQQEEAVEFSKQYSGTAVIDCARPTPRSTWVKLCFLEYGNKGLQAHCETWKAENTMFMEPVLNWGGCDTGTAYALGVWLWHYHEPALFAESTKTTKCMADTQEELAEWLKGKLP